MKIFYIINEEAKPVNFLKTEDGKVFLKLTDKQTEKDCFGLFAEGMASYIENTNKLLDQHNIVLITTDINNNFKAPIFQ